MQSSSTPSKVVILGGGVGSMATALELTNDPNWREQYSSITVYQMGWRLGGKGASGRGKYGRIEEHGLHVWMGFYENSFRAIRSIYEELDRPAGTPLATWEDAFKKHNFIELMERYDKSWRKWPLHFKPNDQTPGSGLGIPSVWEHIIRSLELLEMVILSSKHTDSNSRPNGVKDKVQTFLKGAGFTFAAVHIEVGVKLLASAKYIVKRLAGGSANYNPKHHKALDLILQKIAKWQKKHYKPVLDNDVLRHTFVMVDFTIACIRGLLSSGLIGKNVDFDVLDEYDMVDWLKTNGASDVTCESGLVHGMYDLMLAYDDGDVSKPSFGAGTFLHFAIRMSLTYRGAIFWKMQAGMGDTIFTPIYEVLKRRGVEFEFFHCVDKLKIDKDGMNIGSIDIDIQATPKSDSYNPLVDINDLACWPAEPNFDQLVEGEELKEKKINLESFWTPWKRVGKKTLKYGRDFDIVVLGIPVGSHPYICSELIKKNTRWSDMTANVKTIQTLALQLWMQPDLKGLGWEDESPIIDSYVEPFNTWADMSQLIDREQWPASSNVNNIAYFCGPMIGDIAPKSASDTPALRKQAVKNAAIKWLKSNPEFLWPKAVTSDGALNWSILSDPEDRTGIDRLEAQFWRANIDPSERYVLSVAKSTKHRMRTDDTGFDNLYVAGDWTWNPMNVGCVEGTFMSGMMAANKIKGLPIGEGIIGYNRS